MLARRLPAGVHLTMPTHQVTDIPKLATAVPLLPNLPGVFRLRHGGVIARAAALSKDENNDQGLCDPRDPHAE